MAFLHKAALATAMLAGLMMGGPASAQAVNDHAEEAGRGITLNHALRSGFSNGFRSRLEQASHYHRERLANYYDSYPGTDRPFSYDRAPQAWVNVQVGTVDFGALAFTDQLGGTGVASDVDGDNYLVEAGWDGMMTQNLFGGIGAYYGFSNAESSGTETELTSGGMTLYGRAMFGGFFIDAMVGYAYQNFVNLRMTGTGALARGNVGGDEISAEIYAGYDFWLGAWSFTTSAGVGFATHTIFDYTEKDAPGLNLTYSEQEGDALIGRIELGASRTIRADRINAIVLHAKIGFETDLTGTGHDLTFENIAALTGPETYTFEDRERQAVTGRLGIGIPVAGPVRADLFYDGAFSVSGIDDTRHMISARLVLKLD